MSIVAGFEDPTKQSIPSVVNKRRETGVVSLLLFAVGAIAAIPLSRLTAPGVESDIMKHAALSVDIVESGNALSYSLWYPLIWIASAGGNPDLFRSASIVLLVAFVVAKAGVIYLIARSSRVDCWESAVIAFSLSFIAPLIDPNAPTDIYLGQISATVWHNSTNIMVAPFALAAFWATLRFYRRPDIRSAGLVAATLVVCVLVKPNYPLALIPVAGLAMILALRAHKTRIAPSLGMLTLAFLPAVLTLAGQYLIIYAGDFVRSASIGVAPFDMWNRFSDNLALSLALSLGSAVLATALLAVARALNAEVVVAAVAVTVAVLQLILFVEISTDTGAIAASGNWFWGAYTALMVLYVWVTLALRDMASTGSSVRKRGWAIVALSALGFHVVSGLYYALVVGTAAYGNY